MFIKRKIAYERVVGIYRENMLRGRGKIDYNVKFVLVATFKKVVNRS